MLLLTIAVEVTRDTLILFNKPVNL